MKILHNKIDILHITETDSTNLEALRRNVQVCWADFQSAGRGQRGTTWESERAQNLLFSIVVYPQNIEVACQFRLSQAMALAICTALNKIQQGFSIKWPNDIYYKEKKISGTIIETSWKGSFVERCILGVGINVNQTDFVSDAPNPTSLKIITGKETDRETLLCHVLDLFYHEIQQLQNGGDASLSDRYKNLMTWGKGMHRYRDSQGEFLAEMVDVEPSGHLVLRDNDGKTRRYLFKEVKHVFNSLECD